jgi:hypothetical protein
MRRSTGEAHNTLNRRLPFASSLALIVAALGALALSAAASSGGVGTPSPATSETRSAKLSETLCRTTGGGRFVPIPGFPGERIDQRLLPDIRWMQRYFRIHIGDGYSLDPVHSSNGEHPLGLALDITPARNGGWARISRLARLAEPRQNRPRAPFRWVGYAGDAGHGPHHHLHLSWMHSAARYGKPARTVYTRICPA